MLEVLRPISPAIFRLRRHCSLIHLILRYKSVYVQRDRFAPLYASPQWGVGLFP